MSDDCDVTQFLCISFTFRDIRSLAEMQIVIANFHRTVLEAYWELGSGIGTKMTAKYFQLVLSASSCGNFVFVFFFKNGLSFSPKQNFRRFGIYENLGGLFEKR